MLAGQFALIWMAHISFDRCLGYGFKFPGSFRYTHIQTAAGIDRTSEDFCCCGTLAKGVKA